jgi:phosphatidylinositol-4,5-bisphosphate 3-kinase catalytic subunit alpha/beta/delta
MVTRAGHLFHIDFGHFLGHFKQKFGIKRERAPFVLTPAMAAAMGGVKSEGFADFVRKSCRAFNILRENGNLLLNLFVQMVPAGMPELRSALDVAYLQGQLNLDITELGEAEKLFEREIRASLSTTSRQIDDTIHLWVHG